jgi:hypothetical protein
VNLLRCASQSQWHALKVPLPICWFFRSYLYCQIFHIAVDWLRLWLCVLQNSVRASTCSWQLHNNFFHLGIEFLRPSKDLRTEVHWQRLLHYFVVVCGLLFNNHFPWLLSALLRHIRWEAAPVLDFKALASVRENSLNHWRPFAALLPSQLFWSLWAQWRLVGCVPPTLIWTGSMILFDMWASKCLFFSADVAFKPGP